MAFAEFGKQENVFSSASRHFERIFTELSFLYPDFSNRDSRHIVKLTKSPNDRQLASRLKETGYISNIEETEKDDYLRLRIRSIKRR